MSARALLDRRRKPRMPRPKPRAIARLNEAISPVIEALLRTPMGYSVPVMALLAAGAVVWTQLISPIMTVVNLEDLRAEAIDLQTEVSELAEGWSEAEYHVLSKSTSWAEARVFDDLPDVSDWLAHEAERAAKAGLHFAYTKQGSEPVAELPDVVALDIRLKIKVASEGADTHYVRLLRYLRSVMAQEQSGELRDIVLGQLDDEPLTLQAELRTWLWRKSSFGDADSISGITRGDVPRDYEEDS